MRVTIIAIGLRGDIQPHIALGAGLRAAGHSVLIATHAHAEDAVRSHGLDYSPVTGDPRTLIDSKSGQTWLARSYGAIGFIRGVGRLAAATMRERLSDCWQAAQGTDVIIVTPLAILAGYSVAEKLQVPLIRTFFAPASPTRAYPAVSLIPLQLGGRFNLWTYRVAAQLFWLIFRSSANLARQQVLGLPRLASPGPFVDMDQRQWPVLYNYSPVLVPPPADWGGSIHVTGYWFLDRAADWQPPADLVDFLNSGPPPVYVGFGSMANRGPQWTTALVVEALARAGQRGIIRGRPSDLGSAARAGHVHVIEEVPFDWLFPQMVAAVHHGGAGTTGVGLWAGLPTLVIPFLPDQRFWGQQVFELGAGPRPILPRRLTVAGLAHAIDAAVHDSGIRARATAFGERIRAEDGIARAVAAVESDVGSHSERGS